MDNKKKEFMNYKKKNIIMIMNNMNNMGMGGFAYSPQIGGFNQVCSFLLHFRVCIRGNAY